MLRLNVETDHPIASGTSEKIYGFVSGGQAWEVSLLPEENKAEREVRVIARYAAKDLLASGWLSGERTIAGRPALIEARHGKGRVCALRIPAAVSRADVGHVRAASQLVDVGRVDYDTVTHQHMA